MVMSVILCSALGCSRGMIREIKSENQSLRNSLDSLQRQAQLLVQVTTENQTLENENRTLKNRSDSLEDVVAALRAGPENSYREAMDLLAVDRYGEAKTQLESLVQKFPTSSVAGNAREQLAKLAGTLAKIEADRQAKEKQRIEEEKRHQQQDEAKYKPLPHDAAIEQWKQFRNERAEKGTLTTWEFEVGYIDPWGNPRGWLHLDTHFGNLECPVVVQGDGYSSYATVAASGKLPVVREDDWIIVTGLFCAVSKDGEVILTPVRVTNEGFRK